MGARVEISEQGDNLVAALGPQQRQEFGGATSRVCAQGLPNLLHELVHAVQAGVLGDDYGIDYSAIPFDLSTREGRAVLWDELSCCTISCAYLTSQGRAARAGADHAAVAGEVAAWFEEQIGIQPVFYGLEDHPDRFAEIVPRTFRDHADVAELHLERAYAHTERALLCAGATPALARAPRLHPLSLWPRSPWSANNAAE